jgi:hypothetical protein
VEDNVNDIPADARSPEGAHFVREVMRIIGAERPADLVRMLGGKWLERDQERKVYKWHRGESAPNFQGTVALLNLAGLLVEEPTPAATPRAATLADLAALIHAAREAQEKAVGGHSTARRCRGRSGAGADRA